MAVEIGAGAGLTEVLDAERLLRNAERGTEKAERVRMAVEDGDHRHVLLVGGDERLQPRARRAEPAIEPIRTGHDEHVGEDILRRDAPTGVEWPNSRKVLADAMLDVPAAEARQIAETNARDFYRFPR